MKKVPLQMVILDLDNGQRGVFFGAPLVNDLDDEEGHVDRVWFTDIQDIPECASLEDLTAMVMEQFRPRGETLQ